MLLADFQFDLPEDLIASHPLPKRDDSRLLVADRKTGKIEHAGVKDLNRWIRPSDLLILNNSKVIPARLSAGQGSIEILLLEETSPRHWLCIGKPGKKIRAGARLTLDPLAPGLPPVSAEILQSLSDGSRVIRFHEDFRLEDYGTLPLPPYIEEARKNAHEPALVSEDEERYQTVYAEPSGSVAAPTAGLHFTSGLLSQFQHAFVTLHVGLGTFRPVKTERIEDHEMHEERFSIPEGLDEKAGAASRVVAVGTTTARVLESVPSLKPGPGRTRIFIHPPYKPKRVDAMITNFHLPGSTLLMLVAAFMGQDLQRAAYREAIEHRYRFFSYGDAMLIL